ncbi:MAG: ATP synthase F1 subunit delta [Thermodesulfovibrionales bacterium]
MKRPQAIKKCAKMFLNTVGIEAAPKALAELMAVSDLMQRSRGFRGLLENPLFTAEERTKTLKEVSGRLKLSAAAMRFVLYLAEQIMAHTLPDVIRTATALYLEKQKRAKATVVTPIDTNKKYDDTLRVSLKKLTGRDVDIEYVVDPSLLGGLLVKVGSTMYDSSIKGQLRLLKDDLIKR